MTKSGPLSRAETDIVFEQVDRFLVDQIRETGLPIVVMKEGELYRMGADELEKGLEERIARRLAAEAVSAE